MRRHGKYTTNMIEVPTKSVSFRFCYQTMTPPPDTILQASCTPKHPLLLLAQEATHALGFCTCESVSFEFSLLLLQQSQ